MTLQDDVRARTNQIVRATLVTRKSGNVPSEDNVAFMTQGVEIAATYVYADLANSSEMTNFVNPVVGAKIVTSYLDAATRTLKYFGGTVLSFDGDRVMAVYTGDNRNTAAAKAGLAINFHVKHTLEPAFQAVWPTLTEYWSWGHGVGVDTGNVLIIRGGMRGTNDLVSIGSAANVAAKLSGMRGHNYDVFITEAVYADLDPSLYKDDRGWTVWTRVPQQKFGGRWEVVYGSRAVFE